MTPHDDPVFSRPVVEFLTVANEYCHLIEESTSYPPGHLMAYLQRILPLLYLKGSLLPDLQPSDPDQIERYYTEEQWENTFNTLRGILGRHDAFWRIEHPAEELPQPAKGSIAENLTDLHQEMKDLIMLYQKPLTPAKEVAIAVCKDLFQEQWGEKALQAGLMIHNALHPCCHDHDHQS